MQHVLHQHHRAVHQDAEVDRPHRDQVGRQLERVQADESAQQRERNHRRDDQRARDAAEEQPRHRDHQQEAVQQVRVHGAQRVADEQRAVVERLDAHAARQDPVVQLGHLGVHAGEHARGILGAAHQHESLDGFLLLVPADGAAPRRIGLHDLADVPDRHRRPLARLQNRAADVFDRPDVADAAHPQFLVAVPHEAAADVDVRLRQGVGDVAERQTVGAHAVGISADLHFLQVAAEIHHVGDAGHLLQHARDGPLQLAAQLVKIVPVARDAELVHLPERRRLGRERRRHALGQVGGGHALGDVHARDERIGIVVEGERDERQAEEAFAPQLHHARRAVQHALQRHGDAALHLFRRVAWHLRDHGDLRVGDIGKRLDRRVQVGAHTYRSQHCHRHDRRDAAMHAGFDERVEHRTRGAARLRGRRAARLSSPRARPARGPSARAPARRSRRRLRPRGRRSARPCPPDKRCACRLP